MNKLTPKQMAETIRKGDPLGPDFLKKVADTLDGVGYQQFLRLRDENATLKGELAAIKSDTTVTPSMSNGIAWCECPACEYNFMLGNIEENGG
ncbi:hypothetical protein [Pseudodesulfovibrio sediminis]|uniref:Uncharacterized protein n=1 Tax=Pseudodesulfovibrio sediminis TaxID=2810563 RepID=A0ABM7P3G8_9BACT|nr:hypothetical protein [Pseudodesulfovibrio sediminis]BCS87359.1 hypothetical protein PSDVSF_06010 [Pseudodesulfovibrio sediminis]